MTPAIGRMAVSEICRILSATGQQEREQRESENRFVFHNVRFELAVCNSILVVRIIHRARPEFAAVRL